MTDNKIRIEYDSLSTIKKLEESAIAFFKKKISKLIKEDDSLLVFFNPEKLELIREEIKYINIPTNKMRVRVVRDALNDIKVQEINPKHYVEYVFKYISKLGLEYLEQQDKTLIDKLSDKERPEFCDIFVLEMMKEMMQGDKKIKSYLENFIDTTHKHYSDEYNIRKELFSLYKSLKIQESKISKVKSCTSLVEVIDLSLLLSNEYLQDYFDSLQRLAAMTHPSKAFNSNLSPKQFDEYFNEQSSKILNAKNLYDKLLNAVSIHPKINSMHLSNIADEMEAQLFQAFAGRAKLEIDKKSVKHKNGVMAEINDIHSIFNKYRCESECIKLGDFEQVFEQSENKLSLKINLKKLIVHAGSIHPLISQITERAGEEIFKKVSQKQNAGLVMKSLNVKKDNGYITVYFKLHESFETKDRIEILQGVTKILVNSINTVHQNEFWLINHASYPSYNHSSSTVGFSGNILTEATLEIANLNREYSLWKKMYEQELLAPKEVVPRSSKRKI